MLDKIDKPLIMGILNVTPDSFSDGGRYNNIENALQRCRTMIDEGVDIIDIGGESTRPGSESVTGEQQIKRVVPVIAAIRSELSTDIPISIDTTLSEVAEAALNADANIINDISAGQGDQKLLNVAAESRAPIILMHMQGTPKNMQDDPYYDDVVAEVINGLQQRIEDALAAGIGMEQIVLDPGIGFGKRKQDNIDLIAHLERIVAMELPVLLGTSRKRFMGSICDQSNPEELVAATAVTTAIGLMSGVKIFRVHDIKENRQAVDVAWAVKQAKLNLGL